MTFPAKSQNPPPSPDLCPRHGEACRFPGSIGHRVEQPVAPLTRVTWRLSRIPFVIWFAGLVLAVHLLREAGILPDLDWLPGEPRR